MDTPSISKHLPITPAQIVDSALEAANGGAAILHLHARDPENSEPSGDPKHLQMIGPALAGRTDAIINITTGGSTHMTIEGSRSDSAIPSWSSRNVFAEHGIDEVHVHTLAERIAEWRYDWEKPKIESMKKLVFQNTFADIEYILRNLGEEATRFELECYDVGQLYNLAYFVDRKIIKPPFFVQAIFGILSGLGPDPENVVVIRSTADRLFGRDNYHFSVLGAGRHQMSVLTMGAILGANVRVGLEDNLRCTSAE